MLSLALLLLATVMGGSSILVVSGRAARAADADPETLRMLSAVIMAIAICAAFAGGYRVQ